MMVTEIQWTAQQVCGECGVGVFTLRNGLALCDYCEHEHALDPWNLDEGESFEWIGNDTATEAPTLHVVAREITGEGE